jgi:hypothetical protein
LITSSISVFQRALVEALCAGAHFPNGIGGQWSGFEVRCTHSANP